MNRVANCLANFCQAAGRMIVAVSGHQAPAHPGPDRGAAGPGHQASGAGSREPGSQEARKPALTSRDVHTGAWLARGAI